MNIKTKISRYALNHKDGDTSLHVAVPSGRLETDDILCRRDFRVAQSIHELMWLEGASKDN